MSRRITLLGALVLVAGCLFKGPDFFSIVGIDDGIPLQMGDVIGRVTANGSGLSSVPVTLSGPASLSTTTNASGDYAFDGLTAGGQATVTIAEPSGFDCPTTSRTVTIPAGGEVRADFDCTALPTTGTVTGTVTGDGSPLSGANVTLNGSSTTTDASGNFSFSGVAPGQMTITTTADGFDCPTATVNVVAGETASSTVACTQTQTAIDFAEFNWNTIPSTTPFPPGTYNLPLFDRGGAMIPGQTVPALFQGGTFFTQPNPKHTGWQGPGVLRLGNLNALPFPVRQANICPLQAQGSGGLTLFGFDPAGNTIFSQSASTIPNNSGNPANPQCFPVRAPVGQELGAVEVRPANGVFYTDLGGCFQAITDTDAFATCP